MSKRRTFVFFGFFSYLLFLGISWLVRKNYFDSFDFFLTGKTQAFFSRLFDLPFSLLSLIGSAELTTAIAIFTAAVFFRRYKKLPVWFIFFFILFAVEFSGKLFVFHPGPPSVFFRYSLGFFFPSGFVHTNYSYPSGHTARTVFLSSLGLFWAVKSGKSKAEKIFLAFFLSALALLMFISRIYLGEHWFSDVLGGMFLGGSLGIFSLGFL